ncbi:hypothetical protein BpHYR1_021094 [Brachionus plicatilis]|uniref:Uncharacterized protein n=1 Tax=Brachionus plicatilis TaxID=10195 RepID=A0A3M7SLU4_BRAPC|nr:hypothetical protein BpHYR1_021094 [Brachionus plicatilis]
MNTIFVQIKTNLNAFCSSTLPKGKVGKGRVEEELRKGNLQFTKNWFFELNLSNSNFTNSSIRCKH